MRRFMLAGALVLLTAGAGFPALASADPLQPQRPAVRAARRQAAVAQRAARAAQRRWLRTDRDHNGVISRDEWRGRPARFDRLDRNRDGVLTRDEFVRAVRRAARRRLR